MKNQLPSRRNSSTIYFKPDRNISNKRNKNVPRKSWGGTLSGAGQGAALGATLGSVFPGAGTAIGGAVGFVGGAIAGAFGSSAADRRARKLRNKQNKIRWEGQETIRQNELYQGLRNDQSELGDLELSNDNSFYMAKGGKIPPSKKIIAKGWESDPTSAKDSDIWYEPHSSPVPTLQQIIRREISGNPTKPNGIYRDVVVRDPDGIYTTTTYNEKDYDNLLKTNPNLFKSNLNYRGLVKAYGGETSGNSVSSKNYKSLPNGAKLLLNDNGGTSGSHENGDNIPIKKNGNTVAYAEPGEVIVDNTVLSKRLGFADKYLQLEDMKKSIEQEQRMLPKNNKSLIKNVIPSKRKVPLAFTGMDLMNIGQGAATIGNLLLANNTLKNQESDVNRQMAITNAYRPTLNKPLLYNDNVDVSDMTSEVNRGYSSNISGLDNIDPAIASALKNTANTNRINQLGKIFGERGRMVNDIRNKNTDIIRATSAGNNAMIDQGTQFRMQGQLEGLDKKMAIKGQRVTNFQGALSEFNNIFNDRLSLESINQRYSNELGDRGLPKSMRKIDTDKFGRMFSKNGRAFNRGEMLYDDLTSQYESRFKSLGGKLPSKRKSYKY